MIGHLPCSYILERVDKTWDYSCYMFLPVQYIIFYDAPYCEELLDGFIFFKGIGLNCWNRRYKTIFISSISSHVRREY